MAATTLNLTAEVGATFQHRVRVNDGNGDPVDWTTPAATAKLQVLIGIGGAQILELTHAAGLTLGANGEIDIRVEAAEDWTDGSGPLTALANYCYDLAVTQSGTTYRIVEGTFTAKPAVTAPPP
jgi:hypothetical protein